MIFDLASLNAAEKQYYLQHSIAPRPICLASTISSQGQVNLSPFSFFNLFSSNPPIVVFSPARRVRDNTIKHTLENMLDIPEVVINIVTYEMVQQVSLASCDYPREINEFEKAGFTAEPASVIRPPMVKESPIKMEGRVLEIKPLGQEGGAGNLAIVEILRMHIDDRLLDENRKMDQRQIHHVARLGGDWYCSVNESNLFQVEKPNTKLGVGLDNLPASIRKSDTLTANNLGQLANVHEIPTIDASFDDAHLKQIIQYYSLTPDEMEKELHLHARNLLNQGKVQEAWQVLLAGEQATRF